LAWCEDTTDRRYNRPVRRAPRDVGDRLWRDDHLYDFIVEIDHNTRPRVAGRGSAVFLHVARPNRSPTAGCVALAANNLQRLLAGLGPKTQNAIQYQAWVSPRAALSPKTAVPTRTWVAPNSMASGKSALMPMDSSERPLRRAILAVRAKCGAGGSCAGGRHMSPAMTRP